jgi:hypothetical protein
MYTFADVEQEARLFRQRNPSMPIGKAIMYALHELDPHLYHEVVAHPQLSSLRDATNIPALQRHVETVVSRRPFRASKPKIIDYRYA